MGEIRRELILIGPINVGKIPLSGDFMKNQMFLKRFEEVYDLVIPIDTINWKKRPWLLVKIITLMLFHRKASVILSASSGSADRLIKILKLFHLDKRIHYWVLGGSIHKAFESQVYHVKYYLGLKAILVEGKAIVISLNNCGLTNVFCIPNFKYIDYTPIKTNKVDGVIHFVFLSRLEQCKGCDEIIQASDVLRNIGYEGKYDITFYGKTISNQDYYHLFINKIEKHPEIKYWGPINLRDMKNYDELVKYDVMLFPTFWDDEGFPGVVIDSFIAGLPIIASDWNLNKEVVDDGNTGWIVPVHDVQTLADKMKFIIDNPHVLKAMSKKCQKKAADYDSRVVLSEENLKRINLFVM